MTLEDLMKIVGITKEEADTRSITLTGLLEMAIQHDVNIAPLVREINERAIAIEDARIKVYWRNRWSTGPALWEKEYYDSGMTSEMIEEDLRETCYRDWSFSEHYRGFDFVIVKSWNEDPEVMLSIMKAMKQ